jgi:alpha-L-rhamnosidase
MLMNKNPMKKSLFLIGHGLHKLLFFLFLTCCALVPVEAASISVKDLRVEGLSGIQDMIGIGTASPRFSWKIVSDKNNIIQEAYQIIVASSEKNIERGVGDLWDTGKVLSNNQLWIRYQGSLLKSNQRAFVRVRVFTNKGTSDWSEGRTFCVGLLNESKWKGRWIGLEGMDSDSRRGLHTRLAARYLRKEYRLRGPVKSATAYVAGLGLYDFYINGQRIDSAHVLKPVPSDYRKTIYYNMYDVTSVLNAVALDNRLVNSKVKSNKRVRDNGKSDTLTVCLGMILGNGRWFPMRQDKPYKVPVFGLPKCRVNVMVEYADGTVETWATDQTWKMTTHGPIRSNNEYDGEIYDARMELTGKRGERNDWALPGYDDSRWKPAERCALPEGTLQAQTTPNMVIRRLGTDGHPKQIMGNILDFGQNMAGVVRFSVHGEPGDTIRLRYAEKLKKDGSLYRDNLRNALSEDIYICNGKEKGKSCCALFVYHGFRYVEVTGLKSFTKKDFTAYTISDDMASSAWPAPDSMLTCFNTSDTILNKVLRNAWWGIYSNYKGMPVDCPQRNERQPWLGDRTAGCLGESYLFDNERLYNKWMHDIRDSQRSDGCISNVSPSFWNYYEDNVTWPAVFPFACDMLYEQYGNIQPVIDAYPALRKWLDHILEEYDDHGIITKDKYGDWCVPPEKLTLIHSQDPARQTDGELISTAYGIRILQLMEKFARLQHLSADVVYWEAKRSIMTRAFNQKFLVVKRGTSPRPGHVLYPDSVFYGNNTVTANLLPVMFGIVPDSVKGEVMKNIVTGIIIRGNGHVTCGIIGISWLLRVLSDNGFADVAYLLATNKTYPSWGYMAENGATTIWELWNGDKADAKMNSGNHVMLLGDLITWCYQYLAGIRWDASDPVHHIVLKPSFEIQDCFHVHASCESPYGVIGSSWKKTLQHLDWDVEIPCNTIADVYLPDGKVEHIGSGKYHFSVNIPTHNPAIVKDEFLYDFAPFPEAHASTITELKNGDLLAAYFGGTKERNPDVCIWVSRKPKGADYWEAPVMAADGTEDYRHLPLNRTAKPRKACWNPVLFTMPDGEVWLFFKIGKNVPDWQGWVVKSRDGGKTWSRRESLPQGFIGPVKNKPVLINGRLICGSSTEGSDGWRFHVEIYNLATKEWKYVGPVPAVDALMTDDNRIHPIRCIQPSILKLKDGRLQVLMRTHSGKLATSFSTDQGDNWSTVTLTDLPNNQSGTDAVTLKDGRQVLIYNDFETIPGTKKGPRTPLSLALSDDGAHWHHILTLEDSPISQYSYPAIIQGKNGHLYCVYTWRRQRIIFMEIDLKKLK